MTAADRARDAIAAALIQHRCKRLVPSKATWTRALDDTLVALRALDAAGLVPVDRAVADLAAHADLLEVVDAHVIECPIWADGDCNCGQPEAQAALDRAQVCLLAHQQEQEARAALDRVRAREEA